MPREPLPLDKLPDFIKVFDIIAPHLTASEIDPQHGIGLHITSAPPSPGDSNTPILTVPRDLLLCSTNVEIAAKSDTNLAAALNAVPKFTAAARGRIMVFLAVRMLEGARDAWSEYIRFLPRTVPVPTLWSEPSRHLLLGTSLHTATNNKISRLQQEFTAFVEAIADIPFFSQHILDARLKLQDWILIDAWLRSRYIRLPDPIGDTMVPVLDFANHSHPATARYDADAHGNAVLVLNPGVKPQEGLEITIDYSGGEKGASEMLYAYGFIPENEEEKNPNANTVKLFLECQEDDPLGPAKRKVFDGEQTVTFGNDGTWESDWIWLTLLNTEDTLYFRVLTTNDGTRTLEVLFNNHPITSFTQSSFVVPHLHPHPLFPIFHLRAVVLLLSKLETQLEEMERGATAAEQIREFGLAPEQVLRMSEKLRGIEKGVMERAKGKLESERDELLQNPTVLEYLQQQQQQQELEEDPSEAEAEAAAAAAMTTVTATATGEPDLS